MHWFSDTIELVHNAGERMRCDMWDFKQSERVYESAEKMFSAALRKEIERLAKRVIETIPKAKSFCMAMGSASFHCEWREWEDGDESDYWDMDENLNPDELSDGNSYAADLDNLLGKYERTFCMTGYPMMIRRDNVTGELITTSEW